MDDLAAEWDLTLGTVPDGSREVHRRAVVQFGAGPAARRRVSSTGESRPVRSAGVTVGRMTNEWSR